MLNSQYITTIKVDVFQIYTILVNYNKSQTQHQLAKLLVKKKGAPEEHLFTN